MLLALDLAILPPPEVAQRAVELSARLPAHESQGLRLGGDRLPHVTLTQQFVDAGDLESVLACVHEVLRDQPPLALRVTGGARGGRSVWMAVERSLELVVLHERLMEALRPFERAGGTADAFVEGDARPEDLDWVAGYRLFSSGDAYTPHITLGHATEPPIVRPSVFEATAIAACHLGRFCTCRRVFRQWELPLDRA